MKDREGDIAKMPDKNRVAIYLDGSRNKNAVLRGYNGVEVSVHSGDEQVWHREVTSHIKSFARVVFLRKPLYRLRVKMAVKKAEKIAMETFDGVASPEQ